ncbi:MAG: fibronectin type III domain-containing protein [Spongiibacteraceae bacterium]
MASRKLSTIFTITLCALLLHACGGSHGAYNPPDDDDQTSPTTVVNLAGNAGDGAVSLGWDEPASGSTPFSYNIAISPSATNATISSDGTRAIIRGLVNNTSYTFSVTVKNSVGESAAATLLLRPTAVEINIANLSAIDRDTNDSNSPSGIFDPSLLNVNGRIWMAYSSVNYYQQAGHRVQDVSTSLAYSDNSGSTFTYLRTIGTATNATVTPGSGVNPCGNITCTGRWVYEVPFLIDDKTDPDTSKRFKLFAHKYFLYPLATTPEQSPIYALGAIVMWTAPSPESNWSSERVVLGWNGTPQELATTNKINTLNAALNECLTLSEGAATTYQGNLDFVFACSYPNASNTGNTQKIVMLRSSDHASTFEYVSTPLTATDAASVNALYFSAPALIPTETSAPVLIATPVINRSVSIGGNPFSGDFYSGCIAFPFADEKSGKLFRSGSAPLSIWKIGYQANHLNGACAWDRGASSSGILINDGDAISGTSLFRILKTAKSF